MSLTSFHELRVTSVRPETRDAIVVTLEPSAAARDAFRYTPGQHLTFLTWVDGEKIRRSYSICSAVNDATLKIAIKRVAGGLFSNWANEKLVPGAVVEAMAPSGHFGGSLAPAARRHHVAFAAGSGITPILSIVKSVLESEPASGVTLVYGNRASSSVIFKDELSDLKDRFLGRFQLVHVLSREHQDVDLFNGRIDRAKCDALLEQWIPPSSIDVAYLCGPFGMMEDVAASLAAHGVAAEKIRRELFATSLPSVARPPLAHAVQGANECHVTVVQDGRQRHFTLEKGKASLLDSALAQGIELPYSCKGGVCSTCRCKVLAGEVDMDSSFALEDYEIRRGFVLSCQSYPVTDELVVDFDQET